MNNQQVKANKIELKDYCIFFYLIIFNLSIKGSGFY